MEIKVCVGSACYVKGSHQVIETFQKLIKNHCLQEDVELKAAFCIGNCTQAVAVQVDGITYGVEPTMVEAFFEENIYKGGKLCR